MGFDENTLLKLRDSKDGLTRVERVVADFVQEHLEEIPQTSIKQLASRSGASEASVMRFCKALGYRGYRDFIVSISASLGSRGEEAREYTDVRPGDDLKTIIANVAFNNRRAIEDTTAVLDKEAVARAVALLLRANRVEFYGVGASGIVCQDAYRKFRRIRMNCAACTDGASQLTAAALLREGDAAILLSNSGDTMEILDTLQVARESGATVIAITRYTRSPLADGADIVLHVSAPETTIRSGAMGSRIAMLNIVDVLFAGVASAEYDTVKKYLTKTHDVLRWRGQNRG